MPWIFFGAVAALLIYIATRKSELRMAARVLLGLVAVGLIGGGVYLFLDQIERQNTRSAEYLAIGTDEIVLEQLTLEKASNTWLLKGLAQNNSDHVLDALELQLEMRDCKTEALTDCLTVGADDGNARNLDVPPNQARAFEAYFVFRNLPDFKHMDWKATIKETRADLTTR